MRKRVAPITKSNAQGYGMVLWDECFAAVAHDFPRISTESLLIDRAAMDFVRKPESFDVVVASNLFGDILDGPRGDHRREHGSGGQGATSIRRENPPACSNRCTARLDITGQESPIRWRPSCRRQ